MCLGAPKLPQLGQDAQDPLEGTFYNQSTCQDSLSSDTSYSPWRRGVKRAGFNRYLLGL